MTINRNFRRIILVLVGVASWMSANAAVEAQIAPDVRGMFELLVDELDPDLAEKFRRALKNDTSTIQFTPEQFRRFRDSDANPFDGLDDVDARDGRGNIALKFELPSLRNRTVSRYERQSPSQLNQLRSVTGNIGSSTVALFDQRNQVALGMVINQAGLIVTKASEVDAATELFVELPTREKVAAEVLRTDVRNDIALVAIPPHKASYLKPIQLSNVQPQLGSFLVTPASDGQPLALGTYSTNVRSTAAGEQAFLGVQPQTHSQGVLIQEVNRGTASYQAGLKDGDIIIRLAGKPIANVPDLVHTIRMHRPGDQVEIDYLRDGQQRSTVAKLAGMRLNGERAARFKMMSRLGAIPSQRDDGFPVVFQHDTPLFPEQCGGPILDLQGNVVGLNIARAGRASTYAIPANHLQTVIERLVGQTVAQREQP